MTRWVRVVAVLVCGLALTVPAAAQESQAAQTTRKKLQQKITMDAKEVGLKDFLEDVKGEMGKPVNFKINNASGVSNNMKVTFKGKDVPVEKILNDMADKYDFGWHVISNASNNKVDGWVEIRKSKERGYEPGKEPKKSSRRPDEPTAIWVLALAAPLEREASLVWWLGQSPERERRVGVTRRLRR
jgi:hypothetical protein